MNLFSQPVRLPFRSPRPNLDFGYDGNVIFSDEAREWTEPLFCGYEASLTLSFLVSIYRKNYSNDQGYDPEREQTNDEVDHQHRNHESKSWDSQDFLVSEVPVTQPPKQVQDNATIGLLPALDMDNSPIGLYVGCWELLDCMGLPHFSQKETPSAF